MTARIGCHGPRNSMKLARKKFFSLPRAVVLDAHAYAWATLAP